MTSRRWGSNWNWSLTPWLIERCCCGDTALLWLGDKICPSSCLCFVFLRSVTTGSVRSHVQWRQRLSCSGRCGSRWNARHQEAVGSTPPSPQISYGGGGVADHCCGDRLVHHYWGQRFHWSFETNSGHSVQRVVAKIFQKWSFHLFGKYIESCFFFQEGWFVWIIYDHAQLQHFNT